MNTKSKLDSPENEYEVLVREQVEMLILLHRESAERMVETGKRDLAQSYIEQHAMNMTDLREKIIELKNKIEWYEKEYDL